MSSARYGASGTIRKLVLAIVFAAGSAMATAEPVVIAALGDSLTRGYGLQEELGFVPVLQDWLTDKGYDVELRNAGVSGDTTAGGLSRTDWTLAPDVDAMIVTLGGNDVLRGIDPAVSRANLDAILAKARDADVQILLVGMTASDNFGQSFKEDFDAMYPELAEIYGVLYFPSFFQGLAADGDLASAQAFMQADGIHPNARGVERIVEAMGPSVIELIEAVD